MADRTGGRLNTPPATVAVLVATTLAAGLILGVTDAVTRERIDRLVKAEQAKAARDALGLAPTDVLKDEATSDDKGDIKSTAGLRKNRIVGRVYTVPGSGYGGEMQVLVAVDAAGRVVKVSVLQQNETPGLGTKAGLPEYLDQFKGKRVEDPALELSKLGGGIDAVTGATISSKAVLATVREALALEARRARAAGQ